MRTQNNPWVTLKYLTVFGWLGLYLVISDTDASTEVDLAPDLTPEIALTAKQVVHIQMEALANNDSPYPDAGIEITFRFASPSNKRVTGPLSRFVEMVKNPMYKPMINHHDAQYGEVFVKGGASYVPVKITSSTGEQAGYIFILRQQTHPECEGCWMTDGVSRIPLPKSEIGT